MDSISFAETWHQPVPMFYILRIRLFVTPMSSVPPNLLASM
jgi:hypothetical protein